MAAQPATRPYAMRSPARPARPPSPASSPTGLDRVPVPQRDHHRPEPLHSTAWISGSHPQDYCATCAAIVTNEAERVTASASRSRNPQIGRFSPTTVISGSASARCLRFRWRRRCLRRSPVTRSALARAGVVDAVPDYRDPSARLPQSALRRSGPGRIGCESSMPLRHTCAAGPVATLQRRSLVDALPWSTGVVTSQRAHSVQADLAVSASQ